MGVEQGAAQHPVLGWREAEWAESVLAPSKLCPSFTDPFPKLLMTSPKAFLGKSTTESVKISNEHLVS